MKSIEFQWIRWWSLILMVIFSIQQDIFDGKCSIQSIWYYKPKNTSNINQNQFNKKFFVHTEKYLPLRDYEEYHSKACLTCQYEMLQKKFLMKTSIIMNALDSTHTLKFAHFYCDYCAFFRFETELLLLWCHAKQPYLFSRFKCFEAETWAQNHVHFIAICCN